MNSVSDINISPIIEARIIRADGTIEDLGIIAILNTEESGEDNGS